ncbi:MAG: hypothetical protein QXS85_02730 [Acidilobaceae archaeon]
MRDPELERLLSRFEELRAMAERGEIGETAARVAAEHLSAELKKYGYLVVVRKSPSWSRSPRLQVFLSKLGRRGRGRSRVDSVDDYFPDLESLEKRFSKGPR